MEKRMEARLMYIEAQGHVYRGYGRQWPLLVWSPEGRHWTKSELPTPQDWDWGEFLTTREAERCYPGSTTAVLPEDIQQTIAVSAEELMRYRPEIFDFYDFGTSPRRSPEELAEARVRSARLLGDKMPPQLRTALCRT